MRLLISILIAACSAKAVTAPPLENRTVTTRPEPEQELRATVRIDGQPGGKHFQGVWLEFADGKRYVIDYRPRWIWQSFENHEVLVTGHCYQPFGQSISATHYRVERMKFATRPKESLPLVSIGPERIMTGTLRDRPYPAGSKLAGSSELEFTTEGTTYTIEGAWEHPGKTGEKTLAAREIEVNLAHHAQTGGPKIWVSHVVHDGERDRDTPEPCP